MAASLRRTKKKTLVLVLSMNSVQFIKKNTIFKKKITFPEFKMTNLVSGAGVRAALFCREPTQLGRSRIRLRKVVAPQQWFSVISNANNFLEDCLFKGPFSQKKGNESVRVVNCYTRDYCYSDKSIYTLKLFPQQNKK